ncbi:hypothetical protein DYB26_016087, partial [Aphanomyces astaci]
MIKLPKWLSRKKSNASSNPPAAPPFAPPTAQMTAPLRSQSSLSAPTASRLHGNGSTLQTTAPPSQPQPEPLPFQHPLYSMDVDGMIRFKATGK